MTEIDYDKLLPKICKISGCIEHLTQVERMIGLCYNHRQAQRRSKDSSPVPSYLFGGYARSNTKTNVS